MSPSFDRLSAVPKTPKPVEADAEKNPTVREVSHEYRDADGKFLGTVRLRIRTVLAEAHKAALHAAILAQENGEFWAREITHDIFPAETADVIENVVLEPEEGDKIDLLEMVGLKDVPFFSHDTSPGGVTFLGHDIIATPTPNTPVKLFVLLHESGHKRQEKDPAFVAQADALSNKASSRVEESPQIKLRERDANRRALEWVAALKARGFDLTGSFSVDDSVKVYMDPESLFTPKFKELAEAVTASGRITVHELVQLQLDCYRAHEESPT